MDNSLLLVHLVRNTEARRSVEVEALCYKTEGRGFETRWGEWIASIYLTFSAALGPGVYSTSNRNEYQKQKIMFLGVERCRRLRLTSPPSVSWLSRPVVPNGVGTAHRWALKRSKGLFLVQGKFRGRWGPTAAPLGNTRKNTLKSLINTKNHRTYVSTNSSKCLLSKISLY
jgi:hypothetical protein